MSTNLSVVVMSDDPLVRNWISLLIVRDWRTRLLDEISTTQNLSAQILQKDLFLIADFDSRDRNQTLRKLDAIAEKHESLQFIALASTPDEKLMRDLSRRPSYRAFLIKKECTISLAWAVVLVASKYFLYSPSAYECALANELPNPFGGIQLIRDGQFSAAEQRVQAMSRIAIIFSADRRIMADELVISEQWAYTTVSDLYKNLGLTDLSQHTNSLFEQDEQIKAHIAEITAEQKLGKKARDIESLAFHLLTCPLVNSIKTLSSKSG